MNAKYVYSDPVMRVTKDCYVDANGNIIDHGQCRSKHIALPRYTVCSILNPETCELSFGVARCSAKDKFDRKTGRELSYKRAITNPITTIKVPKELKISDVTMDVALQLMNRIEREGNFKF